MNSNVKITIFTPSFNRAHTLRKLYESLLIQTSYNFEWIVIDDGSTDKTQEFIQEFIQDKKIKINYIKVKNGGKHRAINIGVNHSEGDLFMIVDSDDYLCDENVISSILKHDSFLKKNNEFCGIVGNRINNNGKVIGTSLNYCTLDTNFIEYRVKYKIIGDRAEVIKTCVMKEFPFPEFEGENFITEGVIWNRMAQKYQARYVNEDYITCEYLPGGLTDSSFKLSDNNPNGVELMYSEASKIPNMPIFVRFKFAFYFWYLSYNSKNSFYKRLKKIGIKYIWIFPIAIIIRAYKKTK